MGFFTSILSWLSVVDRFGRQPVALESSIFCKLPAELIMQIARFLPPESAASFTISHRAVYLALRDVYLKALEENPLLDRYSFLLLLERDLPKHIVCYHCKRLHAIDEVPVSLYYRYNINTGRLLSCSVADRDLQTSIYIHPQFSFITFQMMMKCHRRGLDCSRYLQLLSQKPLTRYNPGYIDQSEDVAKIVGGSLILRHQRLWMLQDTQSTQPVECWRTVGITICPHFDSVSIGCFDKDTTTLEIVWQDKASSRRNCDEIVRCAYCLTEFRIEFKKRERYENAMLTTIWRDLGEGRSALDHKWQSHVAGIQGHHLLPIEFERGSIRAAFEQT